MCCYDISTPATIRLLSLHEDSVACNPNTHKMHDFLLNIDNKEILSEILHHAVDYLIGTLTKDSSLLEKIAHKYGFANSEEFESAIKIIANVYRMHCQDKMKDTELLGHFSHMSQDLQQSVVDVVTARKSEIVAFLVREHDSRDGKLFESMDWDVRFVMGNSSLGSYRSQLATVVLNCIEADGQRNAINFEVTQSQLEQIIKDLEACHRKLTEMKANNEIAAENAVN